MRCEYCGDTIYRGNFMFVVSEAFDSRYFCCDICAENYLDEQYPDVDREELPDIYSDVFYPEDFL